MTEKRELMTKNFTQIPYEYIKGENILEREKLLLLTLILMTKNSKNTCIFTIRWLCSIQNIPITNTSKIKFIKDTLKEFQENKMLYFSSDILGNDSLDMKSDKLNNNDLIFAESYNSLEKFTSIYDRDVICIINYCNNNNIDKSALIYLYVYLSSCINEDPNNDNYKLCYPSIELLELQTKLSKNTIIKYKQILKDLRIINYDYLGYNMSRDDLKLTNTYYCRMEDTDRLVERMKVLNCMAHMQELSIADKKKMNEKRSLKQKINNLKRKSEPKQNEMEILAELELRYASLCSSDREST